MFLTLLLSGDLTSEFESEPYVPTKHREVLSKYHIDVENASKMLSDCYLDHRKAMRARFEDNADMAINLLKLDHKYRREYIGLGQKGDIVTLVDIQCSSYPAYDQFVKEMKTAEYMNKGIHNKLFDALSEFLVTEFANISEEVDGEF